MYDFTLDEIRTYAYYSNLAYFDQTDITSSPHLLQNGWSYHNAHKNPLTSTSANTASTSSITNYSKTCSEAIKSFFHREYMHCHILVQESEKKIVFAFKGTQLTSPETLSVDTSIITGSFYNLHTDLQIQIKKFVTNDKYKDYSIVCTGHSLGGYIATRVAILLDSDSNIKDRVLGACVFDAPGVERIFQDKNIELNVCRYIIFPNLINCVNFPIGRTFFINSPSSTAAPSDSISTLMIGKFQEFATDEDVSSYFRNLAKEYILNPLIHFILTKTSRALNISPQLMEVSMTILNEGIKLLKDAQKKLQVDAQSTIKQHRLEHRLKIAHTLETHNIRGFIQRLNSNNVTITPVSSGMPTFEQIYDATDLNKFIDEFIAKNPAPPISSINLASFFQKAISCVQDGIATAQRSCTIL